MSIAAKARCGQSSSTRQQDGRGARPTCWTCTLIQRRHHLRCIRRAELLGKLVADRLGHLAQLDHLGLGQVGHLHPLAFELLQRVGAVGANGLALERGRLLGRLHDQLLLVGRQLVPELLAHQQRPDAVDVVGHHGVVLHLVELGGQNGRQRILLTVDHAGLQGRIDLWERHRLGRGAQRRESLDEERVLDHAQLEAGEVLGLLDRSPAVGHLAEAVLPEGQARPAACPAAWPAASARTAHPAAHRPARPC